MRKEENSAERIQQANLINSYKNQVKVGETRNLINVEINLLTNYLTNKKLISFLYSVCRNPRGTT